MANHSGWCYGQSRRCYRSKFYRCSLWSFTYRTKDARRIQKIAAAKLKEKQQGPNAAQMDAQKSKEPTQEERNTALKKDLVKAYTKKLKIIKSSSDTPEDKITKINNLRTEYLNKIKNIDQQKAKFSNKDLLKIAATGGVLGTVLAISIATYQKYQKKTRLKMRIRRI